jgi:hypothetical protein
MLEPTKRVMNEYYTLVVKMDLDFASNNFAKMNFELLHDIEVLYELITLLPLLEEVNNLMKLAQACDVFIVDYVTIIKLCQAYLFSHFVDLEIAFKSNMFYSFKSLMDSFHDLLIMQCILDLNTCIEHLTFDYNGQHIWAKHLDQLTRVVSFVTKKCTFRLWKL